MRKFSISLFNRKEANVILFGLDYTKDSKKVLKKIRDASYFVEPFDMFGRNLIDKVKLFDAGNLKIRDFDEISKNFLKIRKENKVPLMISRGHLPALYVAKELREERLLIFDAHADCKNEYIDELIAFDVDKNKNKKKFNGSTWLRRLLENSDVEVLLLGLRSFDEEELEFLKEKRVKFFTSIDIVRNKMSVLGEISNFSKDSEIYISLDLDIFDPSVLPATDYCEPGGITYFDFVDIINSIEGRVIGADVCCLKPINDNMISEFLAVKSIFHVLSKI
jgi:agmatinase